MNAEQRKLQARCATIGTLLRVAFWFTILLLAVRIGIAFWCFTLPAEHFSAIRQPSETILSINQMTLSLSAEAAAPVAVMAHKKAAFLIGAWSSCLSFAFLCAALWQIRCLFKGIDEDGTPFQQKHVSNLHLAGVLMILQWIVPYIAQIVVFMFWGMWGGTVFGNDALHRGGAWVFIGCVLLCLAQVFQYGCSLQTESDETL